jgi:hypothetical protein
MFRMFLSFAGIREAEPTDSIHTGQVKGGRQHYADTEIVCVAKGGIQAVIVLVAMLACHVVLDRGLN